MTDDVRDCAEQLRAALEANGITLPSLGIDPVTFAGSYPPPHADLISLGACNTTTARKLTEALLKAAAR